MDTGGFSTAHLAVGLLSHLIIIAAGVGGYFFGRFQRPKK